MTIPLLSLHVIPKSSRNEIVGWVCDAAGQSALKIKITAPPEDGKANKALIKFLAGQWKVPAATLELASGTTSRHKRLKIHSETLYRTLLERYR